MNSARRRFLRALGTVGAGGLLAGCQSGSGDGTRTSATTATPTPGETPAERTPTDETPTDSLDPETLKQRAQAFLRLLADGQFEQAHQHFTDRAASVITVDRLENAWTDTAGQKGVLEQFASTSYEGTNANGRKVVVVVAEFADGRQQFTFGFTEAGIAAFRITEPTTAEWTPPAYADESTFSEREVTLDTAGECSLGATLTLPDGDASVPGVVLVHGNGPQDRDETVGPNKTFKDLARGLATRGIAVLRYDKRTYACDVDLAEVTIDDVVTDDALTAVERLRAVDRVDGVFVAGHSFGGLLAPRIANRDGDLAGVVMLAPSPARPMPTLSSLSRNTSPTSTGRSPTPSASS